MSNWAQATEWNESVLVRTHTERGEQMRRLDEAMADDAELHSTQHDVQKNACKTIKLQIAERDRETN